MKHLYSLALLALSSSVFSQGHELVSLPDAVAGEVSSKRSVYHDAAETPIWSEDFASGIPSSWLSTGQASGVINSNAHWVYRGTTTTPSNSVGSQGGYVGTRGPIASASLSNGFIIYDSDFMDNAGISGNQGNGAAAAPHLGILTPPMVDLSANPNVQLSFTEYYRRRQGTQSPTTAVSATYVDFSTDGGATWPHTVELNTHIGNNQETADNYLVQVNASNFIGGEDSAMFRLRFDGRYYFWMVDDIQLVVPQFNKMTFTTYGGAGEIDVQFNSESRYGHLSLAENRPLSFDANAFNFGINAQSNVRLEVDLIDPNGNIQTAISDTVASLNSGDTLSYSNLNTYNTPLLPSAIVGNHQVVYRVVTDSTTEAHQDTLVIAMDSKQMGIDFGDYSNSLGTNTLGYDGSALAVQLQFEATGNEWLYGVEVGISSLTTGGILEISVYDTASFLGYTSGFSPNGILAYAQDSITASDISSNLKYVDLTTVNGPTELTSQGVFVIVTLFSNNGADLIRIINDKTLKQFGQAKMMYKTDAARWYTGYSNSMTLNAPWIRADICPKDLAGAACALSTEELNMNSLLLPNPANTHCVIDVPVANGRLSYLIIHDMFGRVMFEGDYIIGSEVDLSTFSVGMYVIGLTLDGQSKAMKLLVQ